MFIGFQTTLQYEGAMGAVHCTLYSVHYMALSALADLVKMDWVLNSALSVLHHSALKWVQLCSRILSSALLQY